MPSNISTLREGNDLVLGLMLISLGFLCQFSGSLFAVLLSTRGANVRLTEGITTRELNILDSDDRVRATIATLPNEGTVRLALSDQNGNVRLSVGVATNGGSGIAMFDERHTDRVGLRASFSVLADGRPGFSLIDEQGEHRVNLFLSTNGTPVLLFSDSAGSPRLELGMLGDRGPSLSFTDKNGKPRANFGLSEDQSPNLVMGDQSGNSRIVLSALPNGDAGLVLRDKNGRERAGLAISTDGKSLIEPMK